MDLLLTIILSAVEGITEFLPISSTGHLVLTSSLLSIPQTPFVKSFEIIIQLGAILAIVALYWKKLLDTKLWPSLLSAFIPTAIVGFALYRVIKEFLIGNDFITVLALILGGVVFIVFEYWDKNRNASIESVEELTIKQSFIIGLIQSTSVIPGVSRAGATILGSMILGANRKTATQFSFLLAVPTMIAATGLDIIKTRLAFSQDELFLLIVGFIGSFIFALLAVKLFINYVSKHNFIPFGIYRIAVGIIFYLILLR